MSTELRNWQPIRSSKVLVRKINSTFLSSLLQWVHKILNKFETGNNTFLNKPIPLPYRQKDTGTRYI